MQGDKAAPGAVSLAFDRYNRSRFSVRVAVLLLTERFALCILSGMSRESKYYLVFVALNVD